MPESTRDQEMDFMAKYIGAVYQGAGSSNCIKANLDNLDVDTLIRLAEAKADNVSGGHLTILRFTTHWKAVLDTPDTSYHFDSGEMTNELMRLTPFKTLEEALIALLLDQN